MRFGPFGPALVVPFAVENEGAVRVWVADCEERGCHVAGGEPVTKRSALCEDSGRVPIVVQALLGERPFESSDLGVGGRRVSDQAEDRRGAWECPTPELELE